MGFLRCWRWRCNHCVADNAHVISLFRFSAFVCVCVSMCSAGYFCALFFRRGAPLSVYLVSFLLCSDWFCCVCSGISGGRGSQFDSHPFYCCCCFDCTIPRSFHTQIVDRIFLCSVLTPKKGK